MWFIAYALRHVAGYFRLRLRNPAIPSACSPSKATKRFLTTSPCFGALMAQPFGGLAQRGSRNLSGSAYCPLPLDSPLIFKCMTPNEIAYKFFLENEWRPDIMTLMRRKYRYAIESGKLKRQPCAACGAKAEAHHPSLIRGLYSVLWLCREHHRAAHLTRGELI